MISLLEVFSKNPKDVFLGVVNRGQYKTIGVVEDPLEFGPEDPVRLGYPIDFFMIISKLTDGTESYRPIVTNTELGLFCEDVIPPDLVSGERRSLVKIITADSWLGNFYFGAVKNLPNQRVTYQAPEIRNSKPGAANAT